MKTIPVINICIYVANAILFGYLGNWVASAFAVVIIVNIFANPFSYKRSFLERNPTYLP